MATVVATTYKEFGDRTQCDYTTVSRLMSGDRAPSTRLLARICKEFGIDEGQALRVLAKDHKRDDGRTTLFAAFLRDRTLADPGGE